MDYIKQECQVSISDSKDFMSEFMKKLENGNLAIERELSVEEEFALDESSIDKKTDEYANILKSPILEKVFEDDKGQ